MLELDKSNLKNADTTLQHTDSTVEPCPVPIHEIKRTTVAGHHNHETHQLNRNKSCTKTRLEKMKSYLEEFESDTNSLDSGSSGSFGLGKMCDKNCSKQCWKFFSQIGLVLFIFGLIYLAMEVKKMLLKQCHCNQEVEMETNLTNLVNATNMTYGYGSKGFFCPQHNSFSCKSCLEGRHLVSTDFWLFLNYFNITINSCYENECTCNRISDNSSFIYEPAVGSNCEFHGGEICVKKELPLF